MEAPLEAIGAMPLLANFPSGCLAQGLGEVFGEAMICDAAGTTGALAAATNAIADALAQAGRLD
ncbi:MAG: hypothetical protein B7Z57_13895 [Acidiphilium sp. 37-60-79]|nr:MAG: hypothetical protein B7Z57_13895 [Acidiphilium sp. 37-60-79]